MQLHVVSVPVVSQMEYERQIASVRAQNALEGDFSISQAELSSRQAMLENASDIKVHSSSASSLHLFTSEKHASGHFLLFSKHPV